MGARINSKLLVASPQTASGYFVVSLARTITLVNCINAEMTVLNAKPLISSSTFLIVWCKARRKVLICSSLVEGSGLSGAGSSNRFQIRGQPAIRARQTVHLPGVAEPKVADEHFIGANVPGANWATISSGVMTLPLDLAIFLYLPSFICGARSCPDF